MDVLKYFSTLMPEDCTNRSKSPHILRMFTALTNTKQLLQALIPVYIANLTGLVTNKIHSLST